MADAGSGRTRRRHEATPDDSAVAALADLSPSSTGCTWPRPGPWPPLGASSTSATRTHTEVPQGGRTILASSTEIMPSSHGRRPASPTAGSRAPTATVVRRPAHGVSNRAPSRQRHSLVPPLYTISTTEFPAPSSRKFAQPLRYGSQRRCPLREDGRTQQLRRASTEDLELPARRRLCDALG